MKVVIYDNVTDFKAVFSNGCIINSELMSFTNLLDLIDKIKIDKQNITIYNKDMKESYL